MYVSFDSICPFKYKKWVYGTNFIYICIYYTYLSHDHSDIGAKIQNTLNELSQPVVVVVDPFAT